MKSREDPRRACLSAPSSTPVIGSLVIKLFLLGTKLIILENGRQCCGLEGKGVSTGLKS